MTRDEQSFSRDDDLDIDLSEIRANPGLTPDYVLDFVRACPSDVAADVVGVLPPTKAVGENVPRVSRAWIAALAMAAVIACLGIGLWNQNARANNISRNLQYLNQSGVGKAGLWKPTENQSLAQTGTPQYEKNHLEFVNFLPPDFVAAEGSGMVTVLARNVRLGCLLNWTVGDEQPREIQIAPGETKLQLPAGMPATILVKPSVIAQWFQAVGIVLIRDGKESYLGTSLGKITLPLKDGDTVVLHFEQPIPPWNAICVPIRGEWVIVTLERPWSSLDTDKWLRGEWKGSNELPNTALFWAREGTAGMARELAAYFVEHRNTGDSGRYRGGMQTSIMVQAKKGALSETMQKIDQNELQRALESAFELLRGQQPPLGLTIEEEIHQAGEILKQRAATPTP